ncbi:MAG TPA: ribose-phosphate pyrophosphokinase [bacterium]|nr:ribose-phosphate pyrophosphokinase [bacterium]HPN44878.1 ribose-phosphate pyrophosphokinase [bacterium]
MVNSSKTPEIKIFSGRSNPGLAEKIASSMNRPLDQVEIKNFSDGEIWVKYKENIRGTDVFIIQPTNAPAENLLELLIMIDAARRASASSITAVIPYFGYARQDRKDQPRVAISSKLVANLLTKAGVNRVLTMDLHAPQIQGFFDIPLDHLYAATIFIDHIKKQNLPNLVVASPDIGGIHLARAYASRLGSDLVMMNKRRIKHNVCCVTELIGDVRDKNVLVVDDMIDTAGTLVNGVKVLKEKGANDIYVACTHALLSGNAVELIKNSEITKIYCSNSTNIPEHKQLDNMEILCISRLFGEAITRIHEERSISDLFPQKGPMH